MDDRQWEQKNSGDNGDDHEETQLKKAGNICQETQIKWGKTSCRSYLQDL